MKQQALSPRAACIVSKKSGAKLSFRPSNSSTGWDAEFTCTTIQSVIGCQKILAAAIDCSIMTRFELGKSVVSTTSIHPLTEDF